MFDGTLKGIGLFASELIHLISLGKEETIQSVEQHISNGDVVTYIFKKYKEDFAVQFNEESPYDVSAINKYFSRFDGVVNGEESRKYGIMNSSEGLLLLIVLLMDKVESEAYKWVLE